MSFVRKSEGPHFDPINGLPSDIDHPVRTRVTKGVIGGDLPPLLTSIVGLAIVASTTKDRFSQIGKRTNRQELDGS